MTVTVQLPACEAPATVAVEAYAARQSLYGSLDATVYCCAGHEADASRAIAAAGLTPFERRSDRPVADGTTCGYVFDYTTVGRRKPD